MAKKTIDLIFKIAEIAIFILFAIMSVLIFFQVFNRFITNQSLTWSEEISRYLMIWVIFLASAVVFRTNAHMAVNNLVDALKGNAKKTIIVISTIFQALFVALIIYAAIGLMPMVAGQFSPAQRINMAIPYSSIPVFAVLCIVALIEKIFITGLFTEHENIDPDLEEILKQSAETGTSEVVEASQETATEEPTQADEGGE